MKIGIVFDFYRRGGDFVVINVLQALSSRDHSLDLWTTQPNEFKKSLKFFGEKQDIKGLKVVKAGSISSKIPHPYSMANIANKIEDQYDLLFLCDDVPKGLDTKVIVYVNYGHALRIFLGSLMKQSGNGWDNKRIMGRLKWKIHELFFKLFFHVKEVPENVEMIANSTLTKIDLMRTFDLNRLPIVYPPVNSQKIYKLSREKSSKKNLAIFVGEITPGKGVEEIIRVANKVKKRTDTNFVIIGHIGNRSYLGRLKNKIRDLGLDTRVKVLPNAPREEVIQQLIKAKYYIHPKPDEHFGISVAEGMAAGCIPIVKKGLNGSWLDLVKKGKYGFGYKTPTDLAKILTSTKNRINTHKVASKSLDFDKKVFRRRILNLFEQFRKC